MIPPGSFRGFRRWSNANKATVVGVDVPNRTNIEIHPADWAKQLLGCIATGGSMDSERAFADSDNRAAFQKVMAVVPESFTVLVA